MRSLLLVLSMVIAPKSATSKSIRGRRSTLRQIRYKDITPDSQPEKRIPTTYLISVKINTLGKSQKTLSNANFTPLVGVRITRHSPTIRKKVMKRMERKVPGPVMSV